MIRALTRAIRDATLTGVAPAGVCWVAYHSAVAHTASDAVSTGTADTGDHQS